MGWIATVAAPPEAGPGAEKEPQSHPLRCALIDVDRSSSGILLEAWLAEGEGRTWLERSETEKALTNQKELQLAFDAEGVRQRAALGRSLKADVVVLLRTTAAGKRKNAELVVAETAGGLRLLIRRMACSDNPESDARLLAAWIDEALKKYGETIREVYAIPPFVCPDGSHRYDYLQAAYAKLLEQAFLSRPGLLLVEIAEAEAIARESGAVPPDEDLRKFRPVRWIGECRYETREETLRVALTLRAQRGSETLGEVQESLPSAEVTDRLVEMAGRLIAPDASPGAKPDRNQEPPNRTLRGDGAPPACRRRIGQINRFPLDSAPRRFGGNSGNRHLRDNTMDRCALNLWRRTRGCGPSDGLR